MRKQEREPNKIKCVIFFNFFSFIVCGVAVVCLICVVNSVIHAETKHSRADDVFYSSLFWLLVAHSAIFVHFFFLLPISPYIGRLGMSVDFNGFIYFLTFDRLQWNYELWTVKPMKRKTKTKFSRSIGMAKESNKMVYLIAWLIHSYIVLCRIS